MLDGDALIGLIAGVTFPPLGGFKCGGFSPQLCFLNTLEQGHEKPQTITDCSAIVTGVLLAMSVSPATPWWLMVVGAAFAI